MTDESDRGPEAVFYAALDRPVEERGEFVRRMCGGDAPALAEVLSLLAAHAKAAQFLSSPVEDATFGDAAAALPDPLLGRGIGPYRITSLLGSGGMSTVYLAERADAAYSMQVAVKLIRPGMDTEDILRRFRNERQVLANLDHPNIARLLDGGATEEGRPYLVMEKIDGMSIDRYCDERALSITQRLALFRTVCAAVHYAHQNLVVHRDLKPSNILVSVTGEVKLLDFGIAKVLSPVDPHDPEGATMTGQRPMTPRYASPEQVRGEAVTTVSDVYSLGVVLYELLTGHTPYAIDDRTPAEVERIVCAEQPARPSAIVGSTTATRGGARRASRTPESVCASREGEPRRLAKRLAGDLDNIAMMALRKEPDRRYASVERLSDDIRRHLEGLPVLARADTFAYRTAKFVRRHAAAVGLAAVVVFGLIASTLVSTGLYFRADRAKAAAVAAQQEAETQRATAEEINQFLQGMLNSIDPQTARGRDVTILRELLDGAAARIDSELQDVPLVASSLHRTIGNTYRSVGHFAEAETHLRAALQIGSAATGAQSTETAACLVDLGAVLFDIGDYSGAEPLFREALAIQRQTAGGEGSAVARSLDRLGRLLEATGKYDEAEPCLRESLAIRRAAAGDGAPEVASSLVTLGTFLFLTRQRAADAEPLLREAIAIMERAPGTRPIDRASALTSLGSLLRDAKDYDEAEPMLREALAIERRVLGAGHPELGTTINNLASLLERTGRLDEGETLFRETLGIRKASLGERHRDVGTAANNLAGVLRKTGRLGEAEALYRTTLDIYTDVLGPDHAWVSIAIANLLTVLQAKGECEAARPLIEECRRIQRTFLPDDHWRCAGVESIRGACLAANGHDAEAEPILVESARFLELDRGVEDDWTRRAILRLVDFYETRGRRAEAERHRARLEVVAR